MVNDLLVKILILTMLNHMHPMVSYGINMVYYGSLWYPMVSYGILTYGFLWYQHGISIPPMVACGTSPLDTLGLEVDTDCAQMIFLVRSERVVAWRSGAAMGWKCPAGWVFQRSKLAWYRTMV